MADFIQVNVITDAGKAAIANALLTATAVDLTEFAVGSGDVTGIGDLEAQTALVAEEHRGAITAAEVDPEVPGIVTVEFNIPAPVGGFTMTEWGLFDAEGNLFAIGNYPASFKATDTTDATVRVRLVIGNTEAINLVIDPTVAIASRKYVDDKILAAHGSVVVYGALFDAAVTDGKPVRYNSGDQTYYLALADGTANNVAEGIADVTNEQVIKFGATRPGLITGLTAGVRYFLSDAVAGDMVTVAPDDAIKLGHAFSTNVFFVDIDRGGADTGQGHGQCRLAKSGANLVLGTYNGSGLTINGVMVAVPAAGVDLAPDGLDADTTYFIYAYMNAGTMTLEASETGHSTHTDGVEIKTGDPTRTLVGMAHTVAGPAWASTASQILVRSWFNEPLPNGFVKLPANVSTTSTTFVELSTDFRIEVLVWAGEAVKVRPTIIDMNGTTTFGQYTVISFDGTVETAEGTIMFHQSDDINMNATGSPIAIKTNLTEGFHTVSIFGRVDGNTGHWQGEASGRTSANHLQLMGA